MDIFFGAFLLLFNQLEARSSPSARDNRFPFEGASPLTNAYLWISKLWFKIISEKHDFNVA